MGLQAAIEAVTERFVNHEEHPELRRLGEVLALARRQAVIQGQLDDDREALHHGHLSHDELVSRGHHYEMLRHQACTYNHLLRGLIESWGHYFSHHELMDWLTAASLGRADWAQAEIRGSVSEIALHAALQGLPEIKGLRYASVEEDLIGYDFVGVWNGSLMTVDAKTGFYQPLLERKHGHRHLEISVPREVIKDLQVNHRGLALLRKEIRHVLGPDTISEYHSPKHFRMHAHA
ncbi:MAG: hypothetical protein NVSMB39_2450 [Candidatus Saccharimonadales bacterium]